MDWPAYLAQFHDRRAGITRRVLCHCRRGAVEQHRRVRSARRDQAGGRGPAGGGPPGSRPYDWLAEAIPPDTPVLDLACGDAPLSDVLAGRRYLGLDTAMAELRAAAARGATPLLRADATALPLAANAVGAVVCSMALMLATPLDVVLAEVRRVLAPGGRLVALLPARQPVRLRHLPAAAGLLTLVGALRYPNDQALGDAGAALAAAGLRLRADESVEFGYRLDTAAYADLLLASLYLPGLPAGRYRVARTYLRSLVTWRATMPIPLRRLVADRV